jgi:S1-C subfamily serine protease
MKFLLLLPALALACSAAVTDEPVDDGKLKADLLRFGEAQLGAGKTVKLSALKPQLARTRCKVALPPPATQRDSIASAAARVRRGVAVVGSLYKCKKCEHWHLSAASGFFISTDGTLVTNHHVLASPDKETLVVLSADGRKSVVTEVLAADPVADIAIVRCDGPGSTALPLSADAPAGSAVGVWSHPASHFFMLSTGIVSRRFLLRKPGGTSEALAITADYARGSSGGPVFDERGNVIGMVSSTDSVYYNEENGEQKNLQMVFKNCVSARSILALIEPQPAK